jgi:hypothetical protein
LGERGSRRGGSGPDDQPAAIESKTSPEASPGMPAWLPQNGYRRMSQAWSHTTDGFARAAYRVLVEEKRYSAKEVARALGMKYATFHARLIGRVPFRPEEIAALLREAPDIRLVDALLSSSPFVAIPKLESPTETPADGVMRIAIEAISEATTALAEIERAQEGARLGDAQRKAEIDSHIRAAERALALVRLRLETR